MGRERTLQEPRGADKLSGMDAVQRLRFRKKEVVWLLELYLSVCLPYIRLILKESIIERP